MDRSVAVPWEELLAGDELGFCLRPAQALGGPVLGGILSEGAMMGGSADMAGRLASAEATFERIEPGAGRLGLGAR
jgi:hypothetical protein